MNRPAQRLKCLDVQAWRVFTKQEMRDHVEAIKNRVSTTKDGVFKSFPVVRCHLTPVDMYCYLKARFGEPNGFQNWLRKDSSDNWIHWDFNLKSSGEEIYFCGTNREIHIMVSEELSDEDWRDLICGIRSDYRRVAKKKSEILNSLEKWVISQIGTSR